LHALLTARYVTAQHFGEAKNAMRSRASYKGHAIHPALIPFPFAFLTGALVFDAAGWLFGWPDWWRTGALLARAGIAMALVAAVPGIIDYIYTVPPKSSGKKRATQHMLFNLSAVAAVAAAAVVRDAANPSLLALGLEAAGVGLLLYGSSMGGVLVARNQISVDHRYANAGKWKEVTLQVSPGATPAVASEDELEVNQMKLLRIGDRRIVLARTEDSYVAFDDRCTHRGGALSGGAMICGTVQCPWHGSQFDVQSGAVKAGPATQKIQWYSVESRDGQVFLTL
jgi:nitrite reductase/ring-hydroxylating ferredoxin subunit/uncharacterized membrane protein